MALDQAREYLARVIPWPQAGEQGFVNIHWTFPPKDPRPDGKPAWSGRAVVTMHDAVSALTYALKDGSNTLDIYACMSMQSAADARVTSKKGWKYNAPIRLADNAVGLKAFFLDIDLKPEQIDPATGQPKPNQKGYPTWDELISALANFIHVTKLPKPTMMVHSGGGVHVYWLVNQTLTPHEWMPIAACLVEATRQIGLRCDTQCTIDSARVLRIPDTFNRKEATPRAVKFIGVPVDFDYSVDRIRTPLMAYQPVAGTATSLTAGLVDRSLFPPRNLAGDAEQSELQASLDDLRPAPKLDHVLAACGFLADTVKTGGANNDNPLWNLTTLVAAFTEGGRADAHLMSKGHATYTKESTDELFDRKYREKTERGLGWPSCRAISGSGATACSNCAFRGHGKSPLNFEQRPAPNPAGQSVAGSPQAGSGGNSLTTTAFGVAGPVQAGLQPALAGSPSNPAPAQIGPVIGNALPNGYQRDAHHIISKIVPDPNNPGANLLIPIIGYPVLSGWLQENPNVLHFDAVVGKTQKVTQIDLPLEVIATNEQRKHLQMQGFMVPPKDQYLGDFFVAWVTKLQNLYGTVQSSAFGWLNTAGSIDGFVFGDKLWTPNGAQPAATANLVLAQRYRPKGSDTFWLDAAKLVCGVGRPDLEAIVASAFAAPLVRFTGHAGALFSAYSRESGVGKTTAVRLAQAVWGNPIKGIQGLTDTENAVMGIVSEIKSLPLYWDELKSEQQTKKFVNMTFQISSGKGKSRMDSKAQLREPGDWQTLVISASNESLIDHVVSQTNTTTAGLMRIFEYQVAKANGRGVVAVSDASLRISKLNDNYGHVGLLYAQFLGAHHAAIEADMARMQAEVEKETNANQEERFWVSVIACILLGARYGNHLGYQVFDEPSLKTFMYAALREMRNHRSTQTNDLDQGLNVSAILNRFFNETKKSGTWLVTSRIHSGVGKPAANSIKVLHPPDITRLNGVEVHVGVDNHMLRISSSALGLWCRKNEVNKINLLDALKKTALVKQVNGVRMGSGTTAAGAKEHILEIDLSSSTDLDFVSEMI